MPGRKDTEDRRREAILRAAYRIAAREGVAGVTSRAVAEAAGVSTGLVFFYFKTKDALVAALLDWLLLRTLVAGELPEAATGAWRDESPAEQMLAVLRHDIERLPRSRGRVELFFEYWTMGTRDPAIRRTIRAALDRYRDAFVPLARAVIATAPARWKGVTAIDLATVAASFVEGCALRAILEPESFDVDAYMTTLAALVGNPAAVVAARR